MKSHIEEALKGDIRSFRLTTLFLAVITGAMIMIVIKFGAYFHWAIRWGMIGSFAVPALSSLMGWWYSKGYLDGWRVGVNEGEAGVHMEPWRRWFRALLWFRGRHD